jgi:hypothetical protein
MYSNTVQGLWHYCIFAHRAVRMMLVTNDVVREVDDDDEDAAGNGIL